MRRVFLVLSKLNPKTWSEFFQARARKRFSQPRQLLPKCVQAYRDPGYLAKSGLVCAHRTLGAVSSNLLAKMLSLLARPVLSLLGTKRHS